MSDTKISMAELERIKAAGRCKGCGHLQAEHDGGYDPFCTVPECTCEYGETLEMREAARKQWEEEEAKRDKSNDGPFYSTDIMCSRPFERIV